MNTLLTRTRKGRGVVTLLLAVAMLCSLLLPAIPASAQASVLMSIDLDTTTPGIQDTRTANVGDIFDVDLVMDTASNDVGGFESGLSFDAGVLECTNVVVRNGSGDLFAGGFPAGSPVIDNTAGTVSVSGIVAPSTPGYVNGEGAVFTYTFSVHTDGGNAEINPTDIIVASPDAEPMAYIASGGVVNPLLPDLVVSEKYEEWVTPGETYNVTFTITNTGNDVAGASSASVTVDGGMGTIVPIGELAPGASETNTEGPFTLTDDSDTIEVCADVAQAITESDETNNCEENIWSLIEDAIVSIDLDPNTTGIQDTLIVTPSTEFEVDMVLNTGVNNVGGMEAGLSFDASQLECTGVVVRDGSGDLFDGGFPAGIPVIDNVAGTVSVSGIVAPYDPGYVNGEGAVFTYTFHCTAEGYADIDPTNVLIADADAQPIPAEVNGATVQQGESGPDLVVSEKSEQWVMPGETYIVTFTIANVGIDDAGESTAGVYVDGTLVEEIAISALPASDSQTKISAAIAISGIPLEDTIEVCADIHNTVAERDETNNCEENTFAVASDDCFTEVSGNIQALIEITCPNDIEDMNLNVGDNESCGTLNVKSNVLYQCNAYDLNPITEGHMTQWDGSAYGSHQLISPMHVACVAEATDVDLEVGGKVADGVPIDHEVNPEGDDFEVCFQQVVQWGDAPLSGGDVYHIVVTFTASASF